MEDEDGFMIHELTKVQREYVDKIYKREKGEHGINSNKYRSVIFGRYHFQIGDDPFDLQRDWSENEKKRQLTPLS